MFLKNLWWEITSITENPSWRFLFLFIGVVPGTLFLFATSVQNFTGPQQPSFGWSIFTIAVLVASSSALGGWRFRQAPRSLSILAAPWVKERNR